MLIVHVGARLAAPTDHAADQRRRVAQVARTFRTRDDDAGGVVGLHAAVEQMQRLADDAAVDHVVDGVALLVERLRIVRGVLGMHHLHHRHLLGLGAVLVHVAHERGREHLSRALPAIGAAVQRVAVDRCRGTRAGAADAHLRVAVHRTEDRDALAHAGFHDADRDTDQRLGGRAAAVHVHVEVQPDAEIAGKEWRRASSRCRNRTACRRCRRASGRHRASRCARAKVPIARVVLPEPRV